MADKSKDDQQPSTIVGKLSGLVGLYAVFVFISGWTYFDAYYSSFGIYARWLDLSVPETLTKGFRVLFEQHGQWLWLIYVFVVVVPVIFEVVPRFKTHFKSQIIVAAIMLACLPATYFISRDAGLSAASTNQGDNTNLPFIRFNTKCGMFSGRLLFVKEHDLYIHDLTEDKEVKTNGGCFVLSQKERGNHFLYIYRLEDVKEVEIVERRTGG
ncbi:MAG TPA: hypothetical protein VNZ47_10305 [Candidatus Dormibacteraeota bacterium]|nr:hypothetical protein [Candidatus Dormibacteraeota bacterium]